MKQLKTADDIEKLREGGAILAGILEKLCARVEPGRTTGELDDYAHELFEESGGEAAFFQYRPSGAPRPFPGAVCISVNDEVVHGIPNENPRTLTKGDILTFDAGLKYKNRYTDSAVSIGVGEIDAAARKLMDTTKEALAVGIKTARAGNTVEDIGNAVAEVAERAGFGVVAELGGHGVGFKQHEDPFVPNIKQSGLRDKLEAGMVLAIEPILNEGSAEVVFETDGYTVRTKDGKRSAQFEHTIAVTDGEAEILTKK